MPSRAAFGQEIGRERVVDHGEDHQDAVGPERARLGHLPRVDKEFLA
jgi:hypothetical protein